ncbi:hypothetical protein M3Y97_00113400 [Aphelenchoides bicaudatus]|nr:hypothetical protein M3Y97_00113400 [Aphelenchoides bicaudatus]
MMGFSPEAIFYGQYLIKKIHAAKNVDDIQKQYMELVPRLVGITPDLIGLMVNKLKGSKNWALTKRVIEDGLCARFLMNEEMLQKFLRLLADIQPENELASIVEQSEYAKLISKIVDYLLEFANFEETETFLHRKLTPGTISNCAIILLRSNQAQKAWTLINMLVRSDEFKLQIDSKKEPHLQDLLEVFKFALSSDDVKHAANCLELISRYNPRLNITSHINEVVSTFQLSITQKQDLFNFVKKIGSN